MNENNNILTDNSADEKIKNDSNTSDGRDNYEFVTEVIKKKPFNRKKFVLKVLTSVMMGIIVGIVACIVFVMTEPRLYKKVNPETVNEVLIDDEKSEDENSDEIDNNGGAENNSDSPSEQKDASNTDNSAVNQETEKDTSISGEDKKSEDNQSTESIIEGFNDFYEELGNIADSSKEYMVEVTSVSDGTDWFNNSYKNENTVFGIIIADNGKELLIITNFDAINNSNEIEVKFSNGKKFKGFVKNYDAQTGIAVVAVNLDEIDQKTKDIVVMAPLGNSNTMVIVGSPVIAVGAPLGVKDTMAFGRVTSNSSQVELVDNEVRCLTTDIYGSDSAKGIVIDFKGRVLGIITKAGGTNDTKNLIRAYSISDLKPLIEKLSNGRSVAFMGVKGISVTREANEELDVPMGLFVKEVTLDSPAMQAGIQNGDVIVKLGTDSINSLEDYKKAMLKCQPGDTLMVTVKRSTREGYKEISYEIELKNINELK